MKKSKKQEIIAEFGEEVGKHIIAESDALDEHCTRHNITHHSIDVNGYCNMGCC